MLSRVPGGKHCPRLPDAHRRDTRCYQLRAALGWARWVRDHDAGPVLPLRAQQASRCGTSKVTRSGSPLRALAAACRCHPSPTLNLAIHLSVTCRPTCGMRTPSKSFRPLKTKCRPGLLSRLMALPPPTRLAVNLLLTRSPSKQLLSTDGVHSTGIK